jgi:PB1 domain
MNDAGEIVGMVDVLKLTYATLEQINSMSTGDSEGPAWNKFWLSLDNDTESVMSGDGSHHHSHPVRSLMSPDISRGHERHIDISVAPNDSASHTGGDSPPHSVAGPLATPAEEQPFPFKFKAPSGRVHRLQVVSSRGISELISAVTSKLGSEVNAVGGEATFEDGKIGKSGYALSYLDDEGDTVSITTDRDLVDAILLARQGGRDKVDLFVHDPENPPITAIADPQPATTPLSIPPVSTIRERRRFGSEEDESEEEQPARVRNRKTTVQPAEQQQIVAGVPNELLLPGAIVTLAVVIIGVFALTRMSSR